MHRLLRGLPELLNVQLIDLRHKGARHLQQCPALANRRDHPRRTLHLLPPQISTQLYHHVLYLLLLPRLQLHRIALLVPLALEGRKGLELRG